MYQIHRACTRINAADRSFTKTTVISSPPPSEVFVFCQNTCTRLNHAGLTKSAHSFLPDFILVSESDRERDDFTKVWNPLYNQKILSLSILWLCANIGRKVGNSWYILFNKRWIVVIFVEYSFSVRMSM
jgi:hypothetical protein